MNAARAGDGQAIKHSAAGVGLMHRDDVTGSGGRSSDVDVPFRRRTAKQKTNAFSDVKRLNAECADKIRLDLASAPASNVQQTAGRQPENQRPPLNLHPQAPQPSKPAFIDLKVLRLV